MRKGLAALVVVAVIAVAAGGGYLYVQHRAEAAVQDAAARIRSAIGPGGSFDYERADVHPFAGAVDLANVALRLPNGALWHADTMHVVPGGGEGRVATLHAEGLRLAAPGGATLTAASLDARDVFTPVGAGAPITVDPADLTVGHATLRTIAVKTEAGRASVATFDLDDYGAGRPSAVRVSTYEMPLVQRGPIDAVGFAQFSETGFDLATLVATVERGTAMPRLVVGEGNGLTLEGFYAAAGAVRPVTVERATVAARQSAGNGPSASDVAVTGVTILPLGDAQKAQFAQFGLTAIKGSLASSGAYTPTGGVLDLTTLTVEVEGLGRLSVGLDLDRVDATRLAEMRGNPVAAGMALASTARLTGARLGFVDAGLEDKLFALGAQRSGQPVEALRRRIDDGIAATPFLNTPPSVAAALTRFVDHGGSVTITATPASPPTLAMMVQTAQLDPAGLAASLGLAAQ